MDSFDPNIKSELDARLRAVPLPDGLVERLRRAALIDDEGLDAALRYVEVPAGLTERLQRAALIDDQGLDESLRQVTIPKGLNERLRKAVLVDDQGMDETIRQVRVPPRILPKLRDVAKNRDRLKQLIHWASAASLIVAVGLSYLGAIMVVLWMVLPASLIAPPELATETSGDLEAPDFSIGESHDTDPPTAVEQDEPWIADLKYWQNEIGLEHFDRPERMPLDELRKLFGSHDQPSEANALRKVPIGDWAAESGAWPDSEKELLGGSFFDSFDAQPELEKVAGLTPRGIDPPLIAAFPLLRYRQTGIFPFVSPAADERLQRSVVPLGIGTASYELTKRYVAEGRRPPAKDIRTEEFLAAMDYEFPRPKQRALELTTALAASPFPGDSLCLLQIGVQAGNLPPQHRRPVRLVLAIDESGSMRWGGRLAMVRRAVTALTGRLGPNDRISVVAFSEDARLLIEDVGPADADDLSASLKSLSTQTSTNVARGLHRAYALARRYTKSSVTAKENTDPQRTAENPSSEDELSDQKATARVVLLTDGLARLSPAAMDLIKQRLSEAASEGILCDVVDLGQETEPNEQLADLARAGGGTVRRVMGAERVGWALQEILSDRSQIVARDVRLAVTFSPEMVWDYRLLGHEAESMAGLMPPHPEADFHAGQASTALYEVRLKPAASVGHAIADVQLSWKNIAEDGQAASETHSVHMDQLAPSFAEAPLSLQQAAVAAHAAEVFRHTPFARVARKPHSVDRILHLATLVDAGLMQRPSFVELLALLEQASTGNR